MADDIPMNKSWRTYRKLSQKKYRMEWNLFLVEGTRLCLEALRSQWKIEAAYFSNSFQRNPDSEKFQSQINRKNLNAQVLTESNFKKLSNTESPQGILLVVKIPQHNTSADQFLKISNINIFLDGVKDPGNMGTIIRSADWFGIKSIFFSEDCVDPFNPKVVRATMGSLFHLELIKVDKPFETIEELKNRGHFIIGSSPYSKKMLAELEIRQPITLALGGETSGLSKQLQNATDEIVQIPKFGSAESLNVAVAAGILFYHVSQKINL